MKRLVRFTHRAALHVLCSALLALALSVSLLRLWLLPEIETFRASLETRIGDLIGETVRIDGLSARLHGFHPEIAIRGFHILDPEGRSALRFATVRLNLDSFRTFVEGEPRFDRVEVIGPKLSIRRKPDGSITVLGLTLTEKPPAWLLAGRRIDLLDADVDWQDQRSAAPPLHLNRVDLRLRNQGGRHRLGADFALPAELGRSLRLVLDAEGDLFEASGWRGTLYLEGRNLDVGRVSEGLPPSAFGLRAGRADAKVWMRWQDGVRWVAGEFDVRKPVFTHRPESGPEHRLALKSLAGRFRWEPRDHGWRLDLGQFQPEFDRAWPDTRLAVAVTRRADGGLESVAAAATHLDLADLDKALRALPLPDSEAGAVLRSLAPRGTLADPRGFYAPAEPPGRRWALCGRFHGVAVRNRGSVPGFSGLDGSLCGTDGAGSATLSATPGRLDLADLGVKRPVSLAEFKAVLAWRRTKSGWKLDIPELSGRNPELSLAGRAHIQIPNRPDASPFVDFRTRISGMEVAAVRHYLPTVLVPATARWVEQALTQGRISRWDILFHGRTADFPFEKGEGVFESELDAANVTMQYSPNWPALTEADLHAVFRGPGAEIEAFRGRIGAGQVATAHAAIPDMVKTPWLALTGSVHARVAEALDFLTHSPLRRIPERLNRVASVSGEADIALNLRVPLNPRLGEPRVEGIADLRGAALRLDTPDLSVEKLAGPLRFSGEGLRAEALHARILGEPALIDVDHEGDEVLLTVRGRAGIAALRRQFPADAWNHASGAADYRLDLRLPETLDAHGAPVRLALDSDLAGLALDLPAPFGKPAAGARALAVEASVKAGGETSLRLAYGPDLRARLRFGDLERGFRLEGGEIAIGQPLPVSGRGSGLTLAARLDMLDAGEWWRWGKSLAAEGTGAGLFRELQLHIGKLAWNGANRGRFALDLKQDAGTWRGRIDSAFARGAISATPELVSFDLNSLEIPRLPTPPATENKTEAAPPVADPPEPDPATLPGLRVRSQHTLWKGADLGPLELDTERRAHGMIIRNLTVRAGTHALNLSGHWTRTPARAPSTHLEGRLHMDSLGEFLAVLGHRGEVRDTASDLAFALDWPGAPYRFSAGTVAGEVKLNLGKGALLNIEPGLGRVVGMLNLNSLWRRLSLDFSDLFGKGLAYDGIAGTFRIGEGRAVTEAFLIDAVSAKILTTGRAGLVARDLDEIVTVIPHTTAALPIAGALAGGPAVGAALYVAQQLVGEEVDRLTATQYAVKGGWNNPEITRINQNLPLDMLDKAWSGVKNLSGFGKQEGQQQ